MNPLHEAYSEGYRLGYLNGRHDQQHDEPEDLTHGDAFDCWMGGDDLPRGELSPRTRFAIHEMKRLHALALSWARAVSEGDEPVGVCEGCAHPAYHRDCDGIALCGPCMDALIDEWPAKLVVDNREA